MNSNELLPPGKHPFDSPKEEVDAVAFALKQLQTMLLWIDEHRASYKNERTTDPISAENELGFLEDANNQAILHLQRLTELLLAGYSVDPRKQLPKQINNTIWQRTVEILLAERERHYSSNIPTPDYP